MLNSTGSISTPQSSAPHSYNNATAQLEVQEKARFNQTLATIIRKVDALISNAVEDVNRHTHRPHHAQEFVKPLVGYFVSYYQLPALQLSPISTTSQNPTDPNEWDWANWENRHYNLSQFDSTSGSSQICYSLKSDKEQYEINVALNGELGCGERFETCKTRPSVLGNFDADQIENCKNIFDLSKLHSNQLLPLTTFICECIQEGMLTRSLINMLHSM